MLYPNDKKAPGPSAAPSSPSQLPIPSLLNEPTPHTRDLDQQIATKRQLDSFLEANSHIKKPLRYAEPVITELAVVRLALALADFAHPTASAEQVILIQKELVKRAIQSHNSGGIPEDIAQTILCRDPFPAASHPLVEELRAHVLMELHASRTLSCMAGDPRRGALAPATSNSDQPASKPEQALSPAGLATVFAALDKAAEKVVSDFTASSIAVPASDVPLRERCELAGKLLSEVRYNDSTRELFSKPAVEFSGVERHFIGLVEDPRASALFVFKDVGWVGLYLAFNRYPEEVIASAMLAHANNSIRDPEGNWLRESSTPFPEPVREILATLRFGNPDPIRAPDRVSPLSCQRPLRSAHSAPGKITNAVQAIATASTLSPTHEPPLEELLAAVSFVRNESNFHLLASLVKNKFHSRSVTADLGWNGSPRNREKKKRTEGIYEIDAIVRGLREHHSNSSLRTPEHERIREIRHSFNLAFRVAAKLGSIREIHEALKDPFFGPAAQASPWNVPSKLPWYMTWEERNAQTVVDSSPYDGPLLRDLTDEEAGSHIERIASRITGRIRPEHAQARWQHWLLSSLDFSSQPESQRFQAIVQQLSSYCSAASHWPQSAADFLLSKKDALAKSVVASLAAGKQLYFEFDVKGVLTKLQLELLRHEVGAVEDETRFQREVCRFTQAEVRANAGRWDEFTYEWRSREASKFAESPHELYTEQQVADFCRASDTLVSSLHSLKHTASSRGHAGNVRHSLEVGMTLAICGAAADVVVAGILHDLYEHLAHADRLDPLSEPRLPAMRAEVRRQFGQGVDHLIELVTEPRSSQSGSERPFLSRKMAIFRRVQMRHATDPVLARKAIAVLLAAKVSTLTDGVAQLAETGDPRPWSKGDYLENLGVITGTRQLASSLADNNVINVLFDRLILQWLSEGRSFWPSPPGSLKESLAGAQDRDPFALEDLGLRYLSGRGVDRSPNRAAMLLGLFNHVPAAAPLKELYASAPSPTDTETERAEVLLHLRYRAHRRDVWAEYQLGLCHLHGWGVQGRVSEALSYFRTAIETLDRLAPMTEKWRYARRANEELRPHIEFEIAKIYESGAADVAPDKAAAMRHFRRCKEALLSDDAERRFGTFQDTPKAGSEASALASAVYAALARLSREGHGGPLESSKADDYLERAKYWWRMAQESSE